MISITQIPTFINSIMRNTLVFSLLLNSILAGTIGYMVLRLGGLKYVFYRLGHTEVGLYAHRVSLFKKMPDEKGAIIFLGDSQVEQCEWSELLKGVAKQPVLNRGISGDQVDGVFNRLSELNRHNPSKIFICLGINDLLFDKPLRDIETRYFEIVKKLRADNRSAQVCIISVLPVNNDVKRIGIENDQINELNIRLQQIARSFAIPYIDVGTPLLNKKGNLSELFTSDGLHLNADGYFVWKKAIVPFL